MEVLVLHILKLNIIAAVIILLVKLLAVPLKGRVSARWKYFIWLFVAVSLLIPVRVPGSISLVDLQLKKSSPDRIAVQEKDISATVPENGQYISQQETMHPEKRNIQDQDFSRQKIHTVYETGKWMEMATGIFAAVWLIVAVLKLTGEFLAYHLSKLYLPATGYSAEERKLVFCHELTHYVHGDLWYKMLLRICASIYWFNPFLLIMLKEADKDIENLCDTAVIHRVNQSGHRLYRQLLLRTVAMENRIPYVTASLNDSGMVFKDRILYMMSIRKLKRGILPGVLLALMLVGGNLAFTVSALPVGTGTSAQGNSDGAADDDIPYPDFAPFSELVDMQNAPAISDGQAGAGNAEDVSGVAENLQDNASNRMESTAGAVTGSETTTDSVSPSTEDSVQDNTDSTDSGNTGENTDNIDHYAHLPAGVPYTSGFSSASGVASIVAPGEDENDARVLQDNGDGTYSDEIGFIYSSYRTWNDEDYNFGNQLEHHELQSSSGSVDVKQTTNGDYYYRDSDGVGYTDNGDGTWTDENGNTYTE